MTKFEREEMRIHWRRALGETSEGVSWLVRQVRGKEQDVGPHRADAPLGSKS